jgi:hypothetical protein
VSLTLSPVSCLIYILIRITICDLCRFVLLVLESARIEVSVLLNELAYLKYESSKNSQRDDAISQKERNLAILFSLIERIIKMISNASSGEGMSTLLLTLFCLQISRS